MSVYLARRKDGTLKSPYYQFDFTIKINGEYRRFHGSTKETGKKEAREFERQEKKRVRSERPNDHMTLNQVADRYYEEVAKHQASADDTLVALEHICRLMGGRRKFVNLGADDIAHAVRLRSAENVQVWSSRLKKLIFVHKLVSAGTVNRQIVEPFRRLMRRAKKAWKMSVDPSDIAWDMLKREEPEGRVREFTTDEATAFWDFLVQKRPDYVPFIWFLGSRGFRVRAALGIVPRRLDLPKLKVQIDKKTKKGKTTVWVPITGEQAAVIKGEMAKAPGQVWTYVYQGSEKAKHGMRFRITYYGLRRVIFTALAAAGVEDFHIHDLRHDFASKLLRRCRNLKLVQTALGHRDIKSTLRYAHVLDDDVQQGLDLMPEMATTGIQPEWRAKGGKNRA